MDKVWDTVLETVVAGQKTIEEQQRAANVRLDAVEEDAGKQRDAYWALLRALKGMGSDVAGLKCGQGGLREDIAELQDDVAIIKADVADLKHGQGELHLDVTEIKEDYAELKEETERHFDSVEQRFDRLEAHLIRIDLEHGKRLDVIYDAVELNKDQYNSVKADLASVKADLAQIMAALDRLAVAFYNHIQEEKGHPQTP